jgi:hypothetical protein
LEQQIRFLVESYYDIQKLRVETFNRIVAYVKSNPEKFSQRFFETRKEYASHSTTETHRNNASQNRFETHEANASQNPLETQKINASHNVAETHNTFASHSTIENQDEGASQKTFETRISHAVKPSVIAKALVSGKIKPPKEISELVWYHNSLYETEKQLAKRLNAWSKHHPIRIHFLNRIQGIGGVLSSGVIAWLSPISRFPNISKLWSYCGLAPQHKRRRGEKLGYNPRLKTLMWKIATSFEKQNPAKSFYRRIYEQKKRYYMQRADLKQAVEQGQKGAKLHIRLLALRYTAKRFLADLWLQWRRLEGLPVTKPYPHAILGHVDFQEWQPDKEPRMD